jgi:2-polyprenyl-3-methyl-5-hydroxy-6-metoxy-1,4-benzoquinol methylase
MSKYSKIAPKDVEKLKEYLGNLYSHISDGDDVLDFGCSTGYFGELLIRTKGCRVNGVEIDPEDLAKARTVLDKVYSYDLDGDWPDEVYEKKYDVLFFGDVIEHLKFPEETLKKSKALLKPGGRILISTPNIAHISTRLELLAGDFNYESTGILDNTHLRLFTLDTLKKLAAETGYEIVDIDYSLVDFSPAVIKRLLSKLGLSASTLFWEIVNSPEARAYQYKLVFEPLKQGQKIKKLRAPKKPIEEHDKLGEEVVKYRDLSNSLAAETERLQHELQRTSSDLHRITSSRSWRLLKIIRKPYVMIVTRLHKL